jgi:hypothetical protein
MLEIQDKIFFGSIQAFQELAIISLVLVFVLVLVIRSIRHVWRLRDKILLRSNKDLQVKDKILHGSIPDDCKIRLRSDSRLQPLAAACSHLLPAATCSHLLPPENVENSPVPSTGECSKFSGAFHRRMLKILRCFPAATCSHLQPFAPSSHLQPLAATCS